MIDEKDPLLSEAERWISDYDNQEGGALYDWNDETIKQFQDVPIETLLNDPYFLGLEGRLFESVYNDVVDLWNDRRNREVNLAIFLEAIGAGKSFKSSIILWLLWFEMCMHKNPQQAYGLADNSVICIMLLSRSEVQSRRVVFTYCWERFQSGFNKDYFPANPRFSREIRIDRNNTCIYAGTSSALSALGYNVYSAVIDEANFLEVTEDSKKSNDEMYDAGEEMYNAVMNRMTSRFMRQGSIPGVIVLISSPRYPDSFLERKIKEGKAVGIEKLNMFVRSRSLWEAKGSKYFDMSKYFVIDTDSLEIIKEVK
jgi:hypothetical protein|tara:strand:+ start:509 stop:1444 length:936 start_codon:yes stop_codon:yes gene_type:complete